MSSVGQTLSNWGSTAYAAGASAGQTVGHALQTGGAKFIEIAKFAGQKLGEAAVATKDGGFYYGGIALNKISALGSAIKQGTVDGYAAAKPKAIALASSAQSNFLAFNAAAVAKVGVVFDSVAKLSPAAVAPYSGYAVLGLASVVSGVGAGYVLQNRVIDLTKDLKKPAGFTKEQKDNAKAAVNEAADDFGALAVYQALGGKMEDISADLAPCVEAVKKKLADAETNLDAKRTALNAIDVSDKAVIDAKAKLATAEAIEGFSKQDLEKAQQALQAAIEKRESDIKTAKDAVEAFDAKQVNLEKAVSDAEQKRKEAVDDAAAKAKEDPTAPALVTTALDQAVEDAKTAVTAHVNSGVRTSLEQAHQAAVAKEVEGKEGLETAVATAKKAADEAPKAVADAKKVFEDAEKALTEKQNEKTAAEAARIAAETERNNLNAAIDDDIVDAILPIVEKEQLNEVAAENVKVTGTWSYFAKNVALKTAGVGLALFSTVTTAGTIGFVAGNAVPVAAAYAIGAIVPTASYFFAKK